MTSSIPASRADRAGRYAALALLAAGGLLYEIALTRLLSVLYFDGFVYVLLSVAVLGIGVGAAAATALAPLRHARRLPLWFALAGLSATGLVPVLIALAGGGERALGYVLVTIPYAFVGLALATLFAADAENSPHLYLADLAGAGLGGLLAVSALDLWGGIGAGFAGAALLGAGAPLLEPAYLRKTLAALPALGAVLLLAIQPIIGWPAVDYRQVDTPKPITEQLTAGGTVQASRWDALARTDLVVAGGARYLYLDGGAGSLVPDLDAAGSWARDVGAFAFAAVQPDRAFMLGPGGGLDIALALRAGTDHIVAAEVNRASVALSRQLEPELYDARVTVHVDEGRSALRRAGVFDLIMLSQTVTQNAELHGIALTENALYTVEAFREYLAHLAPDGAVALKLYDELTLTRAFTTAVAALATDGRSQAEATRHLIAVLDRRTAQPVPLLLIRKQAFDRAEAIATARTAERLGYGLLFVPGLLEPPPLDALAAGTADLAAVIAGSPEADLTPPRDHRPFFWQFEPGVPRSMRPLLWLFAGVTVILLAWHLLRSRRLAPVERWGLPTVFLLGAGFMLVEIAMLQHLQLLVGRPTLALGGGLAAILIGAGAGSALSSRAHAPFRVAGLGGLLVVALLLVTQWVWPWLAETVGAAPPTARLLVGLLPLALVALPMGVPFPHLLRGLGRVDGAAPGLVRSSHARDRRVALAWAVNGFASVFGAVGATALAVAYGFPVVAATGAACYLAVAALALTAGRDQAP